MTAKKPGRLVVVSNRIALPGETSTGGLASAMQAALQEHGGLWFGWSGKVSNKKQLNSVSHDSIDYATFDLSRQDHDEFYAGFANRIGSEAFRQTLRIVESVDADDQRAAFQAGVQLLDFFQ